MLGAAVASLAAVVEALVRSGTRDAVGVATVVLGVLVVILSWALVNTVFALKYARLYYSGGDGGIDFHQEEPPAYSDFAYVAFTVGMSFAVPDTQIADTLDPQGRSGARSAVLPVRDGRHRRGRQPRHQPGAAGIGDGRHPAGTCHDGRSPVPARQGRPSAGGMRSPVRTARVAAAVRLGASSATWARRSASVVVPGSTWSAAASAGTWVVPATRCPRTRRSRAVRPRRSPGRRAAPRPTGGRDRGVRNSVR